MTQDEIIEMAVQAGLNDEVLVPWSFEMQAFAKLVADKQSSLCYIQEQIAVKLACANAIYKERESCAKWYEDKGWLLDESDVASAIRARGEA